tara:strand:- start:8752 stop:9702 length:951 start_codon:yes stop_codon:yes gene_type:complete
MKDVKCTGERFENQSEMMSKIKGWHGKFGHFNVLTLDHDSPCTGYGKHDRVCTTLPGHDNEYGERVLYCRVDKVWNLGIPSEEQILQVAREQDGTKGDWVLLKSEEWDNGKSIDYYFKRSTDKASLEPEYKSRFVPIGTTHLNVIDKLSSPSFLKLDDDIVYFHMNGQWEASANLATQRLKDEPEKYIPVSPMQWHFDIEKAPSAPCTTRASYFYNGKVVNHNIRVTFSEELFTSSEQSAQADVHVIHIGNMNPADVVEESVKAVELLLNECLEEPEKLQFAYVEHQVLGREPEVTYSDALMFSISSKKLTKIQVD